MRESQKSLLKNVFKVISANNQGNIETIDSLSPSFPK
jgi:hypothetical protein